MTSAVDGRLWLHNNWQKQVWIKNIKIGFSLVLSGSNVQNLHWVNMASPAVCVSPLSPCLLTSCHPSRPSHSRSVKASSPFMNRSLSRGRGHICGGDDLQDERREKLRRGRRGRCWQAESIWDLSFDGFSQFSGSRFSRVSDSLRSVSWISFGFELLVVALETVMDILLFNDFFFFRSDDQSKRFRFSDDDLHEQKHAYSVQHDDENRKTNIKSWTCIHVLVQIQICW